MTDSLDLGVRNFALLEECDTSGKLIKLGLGELQNLDLANDFYFLPFQLLSQGFERIMKCHICLGYFIEHGSYPTELNLKKLGHNLVKLKSEILERYFDDKKAILQEDREFLTKDTELEELLYILSEFGQKSRYHNFSIVTGANNGSINPKARWARFENRLFYGSSEMLHKAFNNDLGHENSGEIARYVIRIFERFMAGIARQFWLGAVAEPGKGFCNSIFDFAMLYEHDLGNTDYRKSTTRFRETLKKRHRRNWFDGLQRRFNSNYHSLKILRKEFNGEWPFYADEVVVECRHRHWCIVSINGFDYALNGSAKGRYKLENPHDAGMAIIGKSLSKFIEIAREL